jgi:hypothetical protein
MVNPWDRAARLAPETNKSGADTQSTAVADDHDSVVQSLLRPGVTVAVASALPKLRPRIERRLRLSVRAKFAAEMMLLTTAASNVSSDDTLATTLVTVS